MDLEEVAQMIRRYFRDFVVFQINFRVETENRGMNGLNEAIVGEESLQCSVVRVEAGKLAQSYCVTL